MNIPKLKISTSRLKVSTPILNLPSLRAKVDQTKTQNNYLVLNLYILRLERPIAESKTTISSLKVTTLYLKKKIKIATFFKLKGNA